jgi:hypothetical protein
MAKSLDMVRRILIEGDAVDTVDLTSERELVRALKMLIYDADQIVRQRACHELGKRLSKMPPDKLDDFIRRLLWRLNPESGDHPIGVPELIGEIGHQSPGRIESFLPSIMSSIEDRGLLPGLLQAAGRIGQKIPGVLLPYTDRISGYLGDNNPTAAGNAVLALCRIYGNASGGPPGELAEGLAKKTGWPDENDSRQIFLFCRSSSGDNDIVKMSLRELALHGAECSCTLCFIIDMDVVHGGNKP